MYKSFKCNPTHEGQCEITHDIVFSRQNGFDAKMLIVIPWICDENKDIRHPVIVFLQGSGWTSPNIYYELPQLCEYARHGYIVATITHRSTREGHPFPAFLQDAKSAVRYIREHAAEYAADPERVVFFGTSSGGNTALLMGLTGDDPRYKTDDCPGFSDSVKAVVDCFGPSDLQLICAGANNEKLLDLASTLVGCDPKSPELFEKINEMSPNRLVKAGASYPPFLILHGDADPTVPYEQSEIMYKTLCDNGYDASLVRVEGATHEGNFWSREIHAEIIAFLDANV